MPRIKTILVLLVVALLVVLPLYELADIGEHWPHDGDVVQIVLCVLFIAGLSVLCRGVACACLASLRRAWAPAPSPAGARIALTIAPRDRSSLFLIFCDLRV
jgi:hypothetical protein